jgi:hypothetical protein
MKKRIILTLMIVSALILLIISLFSNKQKATWITHLDACQPPCWQGITPGETSKEELLDILYSNPLFDTDSIYFRGFDSRTIINDIVYARITNEEKIGFYLIEDIVAYISFHEEPGITLGEAVDLFGEPEYIYSEEYVGAARIMGSAMHRHIIGMSPNQGFILDYDLFRTPRRQRSEITPNINLHDISFFGPKYFEMMVDHKMFTASRGTSTYPPPKKFSERLYPWQGYRKIDELYPHQE